MFAKIVAAVCIAYVSAAILVPPAVKIGVSQAVAMIAAPAAAGCPAAAGDLFG